MSYKIDEQEIINSAINKLPDINTFNKKLVVVYVNDFIGETKIIKENRYSKIYSPNDELIYLDKKNKSYYYYVVFQKTKEKDKWIWDLVGYNKQEIFEL